MLGQDWVPSTEERATPTSAKKRDRDTYYEDDIEHEDTYDDAYHDDDDWYEPESDYQSGRHW